MSESKASNSNFLLSFAGILGGFLIFALVLFVAYLPNRPAPVDQAVVRDRQEKVDAARAAGVGKLSGYEVVDAESGTVRIPIETAMDLTVRAYREASGK